MGDVEIGNLLGGDDGAGSSPVPLDADMNWTVDPWLAIAKLKMVPDGGAVPNKHFVWDLAEANGTRPLSLIQT